MLVCKRYSQCVSETGGSAGLKAGVRRDLNACKKRGLRVKGRV